MRLLATIPEIAVPAVPAQPAFPEAEASTLRVEPAPSPPIRAAGRRRYRVTPKPGFPFVSAAALAVITAVIWSLVAAREAVKPEPRRPDVRLAAEPPTGTGAVR